MAESSRSRVTITLGRRGQVVKKAGRELDNSFGDSQLAMGRKRSARDRLGDDSDFRSQYDNKRPRADVSGMSFSASSATNDMGLSKDDLRFKIMRKNTHKKSQGGGQQSGMDLREMLSRPAQSSTTSNPTRHHMTESKGSRQHFLDSEDSRPHTSELTDPRQHMTETRHRQHLPELNDIRPRIPVPNRLSILGRAPSTNITGALTHMDTSKKTYAPWTLDQLRRRSPDGVVGSSRGYSPPRRVEETQRRPSVRSYDDTRVGSYMSKDAFEFSRPQNSASYMTTAALPARPPKMTPPFAPPIPTSSLVQKSSYIDDQLTVDGFLHSLDLEKYSINFKAEEVDMYALKQMGDNDLKDLGIPLGPRKKIVLALQSRAKRQVW